MCHWIDTDTGRHGTMNGLKTISALFIATADLNGTIMDCSLSSGGKLKTNDAILLLIQGEYVYTSLYLL